MPLRWPFVLSWSSHSVTPPPPYVTPSPPYVTPSPSLHVCLLHTPSLLPLSPHPLVLCLSSLPLFFSVFLPFPLSLSLFSSLFISLSLSSSVYLPSFSLRRQAWCSSSGRSGTVCSCVASAPPPSPGRSWTRPPCGRWCRRWRPTSKRPACSSPQA